MIARYAGASLGLLAFTIAVFGGLVARNPFTVVLSRGILALFVFCFIGLVLGHFAQRVVADHARTREAEIRARLAGGSVATGDHPVADPNPGVGAKAVRS